MMILVIAICTCLTSVLAEKHDIYEGFSVYGVHLRDVSDQDILHNLQVELNVDIWNHGALRVRDALVMVSPEKKAPFLDLLNARGMKHYLHLANVAKSLEESDVEFSRWLQTRSNRQAPYLSYPRYAEVNEYMERIAREFPNLVTLVTAGPSFEGRPVNYLKISSSNFANTSKPIYFLNAAMHAREWVGVPVALYTVHRLVEDLRAEDRDLLENIDWIILPVVNPDGYEYSHTDNRLWRRTRSYNPAVSTECRGVDANRNFDFNFNTTGVSTNPCSDIYPGTHAFSEAETGYVRDILQENINRMQTYLDIHSFGNYVLFPYGNSTLPPNAPQLHVIGAAMGATMDAKKIAKAPYYLVGNSELALYGASGAADCYSQSVGVPLSFTLELPGYEYDFRVPPQYLDQIITETWDGIAVTARISHMLSRNSNQLV